MEKIKFVLMMMFLFAATGLVCAQDNMPAQAADPVADSKIVAGGGVDQTINVTAEVESIDYTKRETVIKLPDGTKRLIAVGPEAYNFDQVKKGDIVKMQLKESLALFVDTMPMDPNASASTVLSRAPKGQKPEGVQTTYRDATATVTAIDYATRDITLLGPEGNTITMNVPLDAAPNFDKIQKGNTVVVRYTSELALKVEPATAEKKEAAMPEMPDMK